MNIKEHIDAGHYPVKDEKGRQVVPMKDGRKATICATDGPDGEEIVGWRSGHEGENPAVCSWQENGCWEVKSCALDLLPPPPRKVKVTRWCVRRISDGYHIGTFGTEAAAKECCPADRFRVFPLTGEYEEPWS